MDVDKIPYHSVQSVAFSIYGTEELKKLSVLEITNLKTLDALGHPTPGGLYDGALGPCDRDELCTTCGLVQVYCPGHIGHISLPLPVFNPVFFRSMYQLIRGSCFSCHSLLSPPFAIQLILAQLKVLDYGLVGMVQELEEVALETVAQSAGSGAIETLVKNKMTEIVNRKLEGLNLESAKLSAQVKNVVECRQRIIKTFIREYLMGAGRKCTSCGVSRKGMSIHNNSRIIFTANVRKAVKVKPKKPPAILKAPEMFDEYDDVEKENNQEEEEEDKFTGQNYLTPLEARKHLHELWKKEQAVLQRLFGLLVTAGKYHQSPIDIFFLDAVIVPPSRFRPLMFLKGRKYENPQTASLNKVLQSCSVLRDVLHMLKKKSEKNLEEQEPLDENVKAVVDKLPGKTLGEKLDIAWNQLQININCVVDSDLDRLSTDKTPGVKQIIEKKEGLFRKNMMGKRVNYAARSVISPDPYIMVDEIGIPDVFAKKLTYPQPVTPWNVQVLRQAVINGPDVHPGAVLVQNEDGSMVKLSPKDKCQREAIAKRLLTPSHSFQSGLQGSKIVYRHLQNGDVLLLNRQPTLHKPSIMAHRARVLPKEKTLRLHYANCKSYNADFDGDEMNAHFPQSELARSEAYNIASVNNQYLVPKDGTPLSGLIQDHVVAGVLLTIRGKFFTRADYQELVFGALTFVQKPIKLLPPAIIRPVVLWSGKQVVSTIIINIIPGNKPPPNIEGKAKVSVKNWQVECPKPWMAGGTPLQGESMSESEVIIRGGEVLCGVLDKAHFGPTPYSLVHCCYELYGGQTSTLLLTSLARVFTHFLQIHAGFTLGIQDILITRKANKKRWKIMRSAETVGNEVAAEALDVTDSDNQEELLDKLQDAHRSKDDRGMKQLDNVMKQITDSFNNKINRVCLPDGLIKKFPDNNLQLMAQSGAKGSSVNCMQISCLLGQIELEGRRVPLMLSGRSLPSFMPYDTSPRAGGFVAGRFLTGIRPQEYFFHCMAGREGLVDTAVKTSRSGYLQRCLIKHLEGIVINYDLTARDSDGSVIQFFYGEDSMDILKCQLLKEQQLSLMVKNHEAIIGEKNLSEIAIKYDLNSVNKSKKEISKWKKKNKNLENNQRRSAFLTFSRAHIDSLREKYSEVNFLTRREAAKEKLQDVWYSLESKAKKRLVKENKSCPDPVTSRLRPDITFGSLPEKLESIVENYIATNPDNLISDDPLHSQSRHYITSEQFRNMIYLKSLKSLCDPGEAVGLLAAQSIGEPSTQMTLNTFHFAGRGEMNVTLGIPRLREILMVASANIATPSMDMPLLKGPDIEKKAEKLRLKLNKVHLFQILEEVTVTELLTVKERQNRYRSYKIHFKFLPYKAYKTHFYVNPSRVLHYMEKVFIKKLVLATRKKLQIMSEFRLLSTATRQERGSKIPQDEDSEGNAVAPEPDGGESSDEGEGDGDTTSTKFRRRHDQDLEYEEPEEEEMMKDEESESDDLEVESTVKQQEGEDDSQEVLEDVVSKKIKKEGENLDVLKATRVNSVLSLNPWIVQYNFDTKKEEWCEVTLQLGLEGSKLDMTSLVEEEAKKAVIQETDKISRSFLITDPRSGGQILKTEGVNLREMFNYDQILDLNKIYSNDIHAVVSTYGIEAAAKSIVKEITNVFAVYGIEVDPRHLSLVADYMTFDGTYKPCNRIGMESSASPLQQMTFETTMNFLKSATLSGFQDPLKSPSSRLVLGHLVAGGTGSFDLLQPRINLSKKSRK